MHLSQIKISGFRNFKNATINLNKKTLLIGPNDIGKSNLIHALRLLLDRGLSELAIEPKDTDFYAFEETNHIIISLKFEGINEECVLAKFKGQVSDTGVLYLQYLATREPQTAQKSYQLMAGRSEDDLQEVTRAYTKALNLNYIDSNRDLSTYIRHQKKALLQDSRERRSAEEVREDDAKIKQVGTSLDGINKEVSNLTFIKNATQNINDELDNLSFHNSIQSVQFDSGASNPEEFIDSLQLVSRVGDKAITVGGDGRNNQIFLAIWASRNSRQPPTPTQVTIYCIEEPEAHLHPHQQRKLATYLADVLPGQVVITTHSPQIACEFPPGSIARLHRDSGGGALAANDGCAELVEKPFCDFGYRLNILPAEAFFSNVVFLVEGPSEVLLYKALAKACEVDLDRLNISILMVDGVGFQTYVDVLDVLRIPVVVRTDLDIIKLPKKTTFRCAGLERAFAICRGMDSRKSIADKYKDDMSKLTELASAMIPATMDQLIAQMRSDLEEAGIFVSNKDLETDLANTPISTVLAEHHGTDSMPALVEAMQDRKATSMFEFLVKYGHGEELKKLQDTSLAKPLLRCRKISEQVDAGTNRRAATNT